MKKEKLFFLTLLVVLIVAPFFVYPIFLAKLLSYTLFALSFHLLMGYTGLLSFGHALFCGMGAYAYGMLIKYYQFPMEAALFLSVSLATFLSFIVGSLAIRRTGIYFSMIILAIAQMFYFLALKWTLTGGEDGLQSVDRISLFFQFNANDQLRIYFFVLFIFFIALMALHKISHSAFGFALRVSKSNELKATTLGYNVKSLKVLCFTLSAAFSALAGCLKVFVIQLASLDDLSWHLSGDVILMSMLGGVGYFWGPALGALVVLVLQNYLTGLGAWLMILQGALFVFCVLFLKDGICGLASSLFSNVYWKKEQEKKS